MKRKKVILILLCLLYLSLLTYLVLFAQGFGRVVTYRDYNLVPFKTIKTYITYRNQVGNMNYITNIYGNIIAFMPLGFFIYTLEKKQHVYKAIIIPFGLSLFIEVAQFLRRVGSFDVDDIILNTFGGFIMYLVLRIIQELFRMKKRGKTV